MGNVTMKSQHNSGWKEPLGIQQQSWIQLHWTLFSCIFIVSKYRDPSASLGTFATSQWKSFSLYLIILPHVAPFVSSLHHAALRSMWSCFLYNVHLIVEDKDAPLARSFHDWINWNFASMPSALAPWSPWSLHWTFTSASDFLCWEAQKWTPSFASHREPKIGRWLRNCPR